MQDSLECKDPQVRPPIPALSFVQTCYKNILSPPLIREELLSLNSSKLSPGGKETCLWG